MHLRRWDASRVSCENNAATAEPLCRSVVIPIYAGCSRANVIGERIGEGRNRMRPDHYVFLTVGSLAFVSQKSVSRVPARRLTDPRKRTELRNTRILRRDSYSRFLSAMQLLPRCIPVIMSRYRNRAASSNDRDGRHSSRKNSA